MTVYAMLQEKWHKKELQDKARRCEPVFGKNETLAVINEKARLRGLTYGYYVLAREQGLYEEDKAIKVQMKYNSHNAFCRHSKRR